MAKAFCIIYGKPTQASRMYAQYKARTSVKKRLQFASLILVFGMQICVSLYHSRFCRSASCNHRDPEAVITHSGIQMFKCKLRLSNPPRLVSSALHGKAHLSFFGSSQEEHTVSIHPALGSWNTQKNKHKLTQACKLLLVVLQSMQACLLRGN